MRKAVFAVVVLAMMTASMAKAESVTYVTGGSFANPNTGFTISNALAPGGISTIHDGTVTGSTITFTGITNDADTPSDIPLGIFMTSVPLTKGEIDAYNGTTFTLTIDQITPAGGIGTILGTLSGTLRRGVTGSGASTLALDWGGASLKLGNVTYTPADLGIAGASFTTPTTLQGNIAAVPVPAAAFGGMGLFALIGSSKLLRRRAA